MANYSTGFFGALFNRSWEISTKSDIFVCTCTDLSQEVSYLDIHGLRVERGLIWDSLVVNTNNDSFTVNGITKGALRSLKADLEQGVKTSLGNLVDEQRSHLGAVTKSIDAFLDEGRYLSKVD